MLNNRLEDLYLTNENYELVENIYKDLSAEIQSTVVVLRLIRDILLDHNRKFIALNLFELEQLLLKKKLNPVAVSHMINGIGHAFNNLECLEFAKIEQYEKEIVLTDIAKQAGLIR